MRVASVNIVNFAQDFSPPRSAGGRAAERKTTVAGVNIVNFARNLARQRRL